MKYSRCWNCRTIITSKECPKCKASNSTKGFELRARELEEEKRDKKRRGKEE